MIPEGEFKDQGGPLKPVRPWWFTLILVLLVLPSFLTPWILADAPNLSMLDTLIKWYPVYLVASAICAWIAYPQRKAVSWIIVALMILSSVSLWVI